MPQMIKIGGGFFGGGELLRINQVNNTIESSSNGGRSWITRCADSRSYGTFLDLMADGKTLLASTSRGLYYSTNSGRSWVRR